MQTLTAEQTFTLFLTAIGAIAGLVGVFLGWLLSRLTERAGRKKKAAGIASILLVEVRALQELVVNRDTFFHSDVYRSHVGLLTDLFTPTTVLRVVSFFTAVEHFAETFTMADRLAARTDLNASARERQVEMIREQADRAKGAVRVAATKAEEALGREGGTVPEVH